MARTNTLETQGCTQNDLSCSMFSRKRVLLLWVILTAAILPAMWFVIAAEREVSQYSTLTFESYARDALAAGQYARVVRICTGAIKTGISRSDHWGKAYLLRAQGYAKQANTEAAVSDLETCAREWSRAYYYPSEADRNEVRTFGTELGLKLLESGDEDAARRAISAAGAGSGRPVEYLHEQAVALTEAQRRALWPEEPCLTLEGFSGSHVSLFESALNEQGRTLSNSRVEVAGGFQQGPSATFALAEAKKDGTTWYGVPIYLPLSEKPFGVRVRLKAEPTVETGIVLSYWFNEARRSETTIDAASRDLGNGWKLFSIQRDFHAERAARAQQLGYDPADGIINRINISPARGPAVQYWVDRIEIYIPAAPGATH